MSKRTSLKRRVPEENSITAMSASAKRKTHQSVHDAKVTEGDYRLLSREQQVVLVRLRTAN